MDEVENMVQIFAEALEALGGELTAFPTSEATGRNVLSVCILCRIFSNLTGIQIMHREELAIEAATLMRSGWESTFWLGAVIHDPGFAKKIHRQDNTSRRSLAGSLLEHPEHVANLSQAEIDALRQRHQNKNPEGGLGELQVKHVAKAAGLGEWYPVYKVYSNLSAHPSAASLNKHLRHDDAGNLIGFDCAPQDAEDWFTILREAAEIVFHAWQFLDELFPKPSRPSMDPLLERYNAGLRARLDRKTAED